MAIKKTNTTQTQTREPQYEVLEECGVIATSAKGWELKLRYISWNQAEPKYDIHWWNVTEAGERCNKGITLTGEEFESLYKIMKKIAEE